MSTFPNQPVVNKSFLYAYGLNVSYLSDKTLTITSGQARDSTNINDITLLSDVVLDFEVTGINGIDTGAVDDAERYDIHVVGDSTKNNVTGTIACLRGNSPILPFGYDMYRRISRCVTDNAIAILPFTTTGNGTTRIINYDTPFEVLNGDSDTFGEVPCYPVVLSYPTTIYFVAALTPGNAGDYMIVRRKGSTGSDVPVFSASVASLEQYGYLTCDCNDEGIVEYKVSNSTGTTANLFVASYLDNI